MQFFAFEIEQPERARLRVEVFGDGGQCLLEGRLEILRFREAAGHLGEKRECAFDFARCDGRCGALRKRLLFVRGVSTTLHCLAFAARTRAISARTRWAYTLAEPQFPGAARHLILSAFASSPEEVDLPRTADALSTQDIGRGVLGSNAKVDVFVSLPTIDQLGDLAHAIGPAEADGDFSSFRIVFAFDGESGHPEPQHSRRG